MTQSVPITLLTWPSWPVTPAGRARPSPYALAVLNLGPGPCTRRSRLAHTLQHAHTGPPCRQGVRVAEAWGARAEAPRRPAPLKPNSLYELDSLQPPRDSRGFYPLPEKQRPREFCVTEKTWAGQGQTPCVAAGVLQGRRAAKGSMGRARAPDSGVLAAGTGPGNSLRSGTPPLSQARLAPPVWAPCFGSRGRWPWSRTCPPATKGQQASFSPTLFSALHHAGHKQPEGLPNTGLVSSVTTVLDGN